MFSQIFTVVLAVLTFVAAAPATGLQGPMAILCSVNAQSAGAKAAYNLRARNLPHLRRPDKHLAAQLRQGRTHLYSPHPRIPRPIR
ncbi:hypothetical protein B0H13DRAFT_2363817 [Mycena leptocephala]|nr:hypothetical protein B0H13DRAFT_2363817 [Mycena leptocephala]